MRTPERLGDRRAQRLGTEPAGPLQEAHERMIGDGETGCRPPAACGRAHASRLRLPGSGMPGSLTGNPIRAQIARHTRIGMSDVPLK